MGTVAARELRNHTADVLRRVAAGDSMTVTIHGRAVAELHPVRSSRPSFLSRADVLDLLSSHRADPGLRGDLEVIAGDTTDDLDPL